jgi:hypothetical protein
MTILPAPKILVFGPPGAGKTWSAWTLLKAGLSVRCVFTEAGGHESILDACHKNNVPTEKLHWHYISQAKLSWASMQKVATVANNMKMGIDKEQTNNVMNLLRVFENYTCQRTGKNFGDVCKWGPDEVLWMDGLSGMNDLIMQNTVGLKPNPAPGEWNIAMSFEGNLVKKLAGDTICWFVLICHVDKVQSEITGIPLISPAAIGAKLGPKLGKDFSEVIYAKRTGESFRWSTSEAQTDVKNRALAISDKLDPDFRPIVEAYRRRSTQASSTAENAAATSPAGAPPVTPKTGN